MKRKVIAAVGLSLALGAFGSQEVFAAKKIGLLLFSSEARYTEAKDNVIAQIKKGGFTETDTTFVVENAEGNKSKAAEIAKKLAGMNLDLAIRTPRSRSRTCRKPRERPASRLSRSP